MKEYKLKEETINLVINYLASQPYAKVVNIIATIQKECQTQLETPKLETED